MLLMFWQAVTTVTVTSDLLLDVVHFTNVLTYLLKP